jgi:hypothetical protein
MSHSSPFRWLVTIVTAVFVPLCCCSLDSVLHLSGTCQGGLCDSASAPDDDDATGALPCHHDHAERHGSHPASPVGDHGPGHKDRGCTCGGDTKVGTVDGKAQSPVPPLTLLALLPSPARCASMSGDVSQARVDSRAPLRPAQTLLRMHCALIV